MNVLLVTPFFTPQTGGVATYLEDLRRGLSRRGHEVKVLVPGDSNGVSLREGVNDGHVYESNLRTPWNPRAPIKAAVAFLVFLLPTLARLALFLRKQRIALVCLEYPMAYMFYLYLLQPFTGIKIVVGLHGGDVHLHHTAPKHEQWAVRTMVQGARKVLAHSASLTQEAREVFGDMGEKCSYLHYWVEGDRLREQAERSANASRVPAGPFALTAAKLYPRKGLDVLLQAISRLTSVPKGFRFVIAGDGPEEDQLKRLAQELKIDDRVDFAGDVPNEEIPRWFRQCEFFVLPSRFEPFGIVLLEAMTFGKAIVATRVGGIPEFVTDGFNGLLVPAENIGALADKIDLLLSREALRTEIGRNGLSRVDKEFGSHAMIGKYEALYSSVLKGN